MFRSDSQDGCSSSLYNSLRSDRANILKAWGASGTLNTTSHRVQVPRNINSSVRGDFWAYSVKILTVVFPRPTGNMQTPFGIFFLTSRYITPIPLQTIGNFRGVLNFNLVNPKLNHSIRTYLLMGCPSSLSSQLDLWWSSKVLTGCGNLRIGRGPS